MRSPSQILQPEGDRLLIFPFLFCFFIILGATLTSCSLAGPKQPFTYRKTWSANDPNLILTYRYTQDPSGDNRSVTQPYFKDAYLAALAGGSERGRAVRNSILFELMGMIDDYYYKNTVNLRDTVIGKNLLVSLAGIGTSFAASLAGGEQIKTVLSAVSTGIQTFNTAVDKEVFLNTSVQAIRFQMDASRAAIAERIALKMTGSPAAYPLEAGLQDIIAYYDAGTVTAGLTALAAKAAEEKETKERKAVQAQDALARAVRTFPELTPTP